MFKLNLKIALRNLWKNKYYTAVNLFGLSTGLAGFVIIMLYINKETGYDKWDSKLQRSYVVAADFTKNGAQNKGTKIKGLLSKVIKDRVPEIETVTIGDFAGYNVNLRHKHGDEEVKMKFAAARVDTNFFKVYPLKPAQGNMQDLFAAKNAVVMSVTAAKKIFGRVDVINETIEQDFGVNFPPVQLVIKALWDDVKQPSSFGFDVILQEDLKAYGSQLLSTPFSTAFTVRSDVNPEKVIQQLNEVYIQEFAKVSNGSTDFNFKPNTSKALQILKEKEGITAIKLITVPISELNISDFYTSNPKKTTIYILLALASFLIIISCINYTNLALVVAQSRAKEVAVKKVLGSFRWTLMKQFLAENAMQCILSFLLALILTELFLPQVNQILSTDLSFFKSSALGLIILQTVLILLGIMLISGVYPALILSNFLPARVLKGNFATSTQIGKIRRILVVFQFTVAIGLVISFGVMYAQLRFMNEREIGLKTAQLMSVAIGKFESRNLSPVRFEHIKDKLLSIKGVEAVTRATEQPINDSGFEDDFAFGNHTLSMETRYVDPNYLATIGANVTRGRDFSYELLATDSLQSVILNESAFHQLGLTKTETQISIIKDEKKQGINVVGVVKDIQAYGFERPVMATAYLVNDYPYHWRRNIIFRLNTKNLSRTLNDIKEAWKEIDPGVDPNFVFADESFASMNKRYEVSKQVIFSFGMLTLMVSFFGLIGFAAYNAKMRTREIAVRKILGASNGSILRLLNVDFVKLVVLATLLADLLAYLYMKQWFNTFAYRIDMPSIVFILVNLAMVLLTVLTVTLQSLNAVKADVVNSLKYE